MIATARQPLKCRHAIPTVGPGWLPSSHARKWKILASTSIHQCPPASDWGTLDQSSLLPPALLHTNKASFRQDVLVIIISSSSSSACFACVCAFLTAFVAIG
ncbi:hypothetical protein XA68_16764 [Ophiocordyceps unilateralis]|uniref:Uncharacterized protein n=1 Tax=Ophiocordyceps unilateralis TaxID=268505 RepID=A0A2A9P5Z2_OPHUN|nr:hypothetical protein XA68_16764 [Ophiocordyceps unilateralis]